MSVSNDNQPLISGDVADPAPVSSVDATVAIPEGYDDESGKMNSIKVRSLFLS